VPGPNRRHERADPANLLGGIDVRTRSCFYAADIDDGGTVGDRSVDGNERSLCGERRALIEERIGRSIDDGHDDEFVVRELALAQS
jgi:hypothetical protein